MSQQAGAMQAGSAVGFNRFMSLVYLVMAIGLAITAYVSHSVASNPDLVRRILFDSWFVWGIFILQIIVVVALSARVMSMSPAVAFILFLVYAVLVGISISTIFIFYSQSSIAQTFLVASGMFLVSSIIGILIRRDLSGMAQFLLMVLFGWLAAWLLSIFFPFSAAFDQTLTIIGIFLFAGLTVWDTNRLKQLSNQLEGKHGIGGLVVIGALTLYLDFINLFLLLLRASNRR
ncbi:MAG: Bax inhibitor-1/YccA family protein [Anaerolineales bacterium]|nr:Bax inhibitor-1/YccA family protein [Anaerolineales bacterium]